MARLHTFPFRRSRKESALVATNKAWRTPDLCVRSPCIGFLLMRETLTALLKQTAGSLEWPAAHHIRKSAICCTLSWPPALQTTPSQGHSYRLDTIDLNWGDKHNLLPHSDSIIYLSLANLECQSIHSNLHPKIVWSKLSYHTGGMRVQKWQSGRDLNICLLKMHKAGEQSSEV